MNPICLKLPEGSQQYSVLYEYMIDNLPQECLMQDMVTILLPNNIYITAGWFPEHNLSGEFTVEVFRKSYNNVFIKLQVKRIEDLVKTIEKLAVVFTGKYYENI